MLRLTALIWAKLSAWEHSTVHTSANRGLGRQGRSEPHYRLRGYVQPSSPIKEGGGRPPFSLLVGEASTEPSVQALLPAVNRGQDPRSLARYIGAGIAFSAIGSVGVGIGVLFNGLLQAMALNPVLVPRLFSSGLLGFALVESAILFALLGGLFVMFV